MTLDNAALRTGAKPSPVLPVLGGRDIPQNIATFVITGPHSRRIADRDDLPPMWGKPVGRFIGWICDPSQASPPKAHVEITQDWFKALKLEFFFDEKGNYLGPDEFGIEPMFRAP